VIKTAAVLFGIVCALGAAHAQEFPAKPVRLVVPFPAGGSGDITGRVVAQKLSERWGQPVLVENRPGGNTIVATEFVGRSAPDGYTLLVGLDASFTMLASAYSKLPYKPSEFVPVTTLIEQPLLISAGPKRPEVRTFADFLNEARAAPGQLNVGYAALVTQVMAEVVKSTGNIQFTLIPYQGSAPALNALLGSQVDLSMSDIGAFAGAVREGRVRGLAVTGPKRSPALPDVPTVLESGLNVNVVSWFGLMAPPGTPAPIAEKLSTDTRAVLQLPDVRERLIAVGLEAAPMAQADFAARIRAEAERWDKVIRGANIRLD
jgi:tripartite-type tricarboxylate transporter receptor subunit TctC